MAQANTDNSITSRRRFMTVVAAASAVSATALASAAMPVHQTCTPGKGGIPMQVDPIHAAVESHAAALRAQHVFLGAQEGLEVELPRELRQSDITIWETTIENGDDPRWIENQRSVAAAFEAGEEAALALITVKPTTIAGLASLLRHVSEYEAAGNEWPTFRDGETDMRNREFAFFLHRNLAAALPI
jgi:hypothetical protein